MRKISVEIEGQIHEVTQRDDGTFEWPTALDRYTAGGASTVAGNVLEWGTGGLNIDACRVPADTGRWPANVILSHHEDCVATGEREDKLVVGIGERIGDSSRLPGTYGMGKRASTTTTTTTTYDCHPDCPTRIVEEQRPDTIRSFFCPKPSKAEKEIGLDHLPVISGSEITGREEGSAGIQNPRAGAGAKGGARNVHVTVKPVALMRYLCKLVTPPGGVVLDVFAGSGTTGVAALAEGFSFVGVEMGGDNNSHLPILLGRIRHALGLPQMLTCPGCSNSREVAAQCACGYVP